MTFNWCSIIDEKQEFVITIGFDLVTEEEKKTSE